MLDEGTTQQLQQKFDMIKPMLMQQFSGVSDEELEQGRSDPNQLVSTIQQKTGQSPDMIEGTLRQLAGS